MDGWKILKHFLAKFPVINKQKKRNFLSKSNLLHRQLLSLTAYQHILILIRELDIKPRPMNINR